jgi:hypothetical protein
MDTLGFVGNGQTSGGSCATLYQPSRSHEQGTGIAPVLGRPDRDHLVNPCAGRSVLAQSHRSPWSRERLNECTSAGGPPRIALSISLAILLAAARSGSSLK